MPAERPKREGKIRHKAASLIREAAGSAQAYAKESPHKARGIVAKLGELGTRTRERARPLAEKAGSAANSAKSKITEAARERRRERRISKEDSPSSPITH